jgi:hypothetical protein
MFRGRREALPISASVTWLKASRLWMRLLSKRSVLELLS